MSENIDEKFIIKNDTNVGLVVILESYPHIIYQGRKIRITFNTVPIRTFLEDSFQKATALVSGQYKLPEHYYIEIVEGLNGRVAKICSEKVEVRETDVSGDEYEKLATQLHSHIRLGQPEYIISAANWYNDGKEHNHQPKNITTGYVVCGRRHHNIFQTVGLLLNNNIDEINKVNKVCEQGFITSKDRWLDREEAGKLAFSIGQIKKETKTLFSEDLY